MKKNSMLRLRTKALDLDGAEEEEAAAAAAEVVDVGVEPVTSGYWWW